VGIVKVCKINNSAMGFSPFFTGFFPYKNEKRYMAILQTSEKNIQAQL